MSKFKEIVLESLSEAKQVGILYHTTDIYGLYQILDSNRMWTNWIHGVSFTRDKNYWYKDFPIQLVIDGDKLSENHKVYPFDYGYACNLEDGTCYRPESETAVLGRGRKLDFDLNKRGDYWGTYDEPDEENEKSMVINNIKRYIIGLRINIKFCKSSEELMNILKTFQDYLPDKPVEFV